MRIVEMRERTVPISWAIASAYIDFSKMTSSLVAVITDVIRDGSRGWLPLQLQWPSWSAPMRERFIPRIMAADAKTLLNASGDNLEPEAIWNTMFKNEKPGGHGEHSVAIGTIDMAIWE